MTLFLVTDEKGYLCRKADAGFYTAFILDRLPVEMAHREVGDLILARTDLDPEYRATYARSRLPGEEGCYYGADIEGYRKNYLQI